MNHEQFQVMLDDLARKATVGQEVLGEVLARVSLQAPEETSRSAIAAGNPTARRPVDQREIPQGTVSKAVRALKDEGLLADGEKSLLSPDGRPLAPIRLGSRYAIAGVKVTQSNKQPRQVTTALVGLDGTRILEPARGRVDRWDQVAELIYRHVASLKSAGDQKRASSGLEPLRMLGVGIEVDSPVYNGEVMPHLSDGSAAPVPLAAWLHRFFDADPGFGQPVPVIVENDVNALAVLAIHQARYAEPDLVVVGVFDEGVGGGLIMDSRLRRGGNGRAMEIGHLAVGFPPGQQEHQPDPQEWDLEAAPAGSPNFYTRCSCGHFGHVDTLAPPRRIQGMLGDLPLDRLGEIDSRDPGFKRARAVFARGGAALGRALAHVSNTVNPSSVIAYLPRALAEPKPDTAAAAYHSAVHQEVTSAFAAGNNADYLKIRALPAKPEELTLGGAKAAAVCVFESFIEHALRLDGCTTALRRSSTASGSFKTVSPLEPDHSWPGRRGNYPA
jgi:predicted NBD/HSP70 family sugar kinase